MAEGIDVRAADGVTSVVINRPEKKNALTVAMYSELADALERADADRSVRVLVLHGTNGCFTAGNDLDDFLKAPISGESSPAVRFMKAIHRLRKPIVAAVEGPAIGIGTTMLLHCDLVYADPSARLALPFVNLGLCPEAACSYLLPRLVGHPRASELLLLGDPISAATALELGLINGVTGANEAVSTALATASRLAEKPTASLAATKWLLKKAHARLVDETIEDELALFVQLLQSPEAHEAFRAFFERRKPDFTPSNN